MTAPVALVTGAGGGLGRAICAALAKAGFAVLATDRTAELVRDLPGCRPHALDVTDSASVAAAAAYVRTEFGRLDVLVNNAGIIAYFPVAEADPDEVIRHFQVNTFGALRTVHALLDLLASSGGRIVNVTSESYRFRTPFQPYQTTKLALEGLSDVLRRELAPIGVRVSTVRPGAIETELFRAMSAIDAPAAGSRLAEPFARFARALARRPPKRVSAPDEVAAVVVRAASDRRPRAHYEINNMLALRIAALLPARVADAAVARVLGGRARRVGGMRSTRSGLPPP